MNRIAMFLGGGLLAAGLSVGVYAHDHEHKEGDEAKAVTIQGELVDAACFVTSGGDESGKSHAKCASQCMASGIPAAIVPEGKKPDDLLYLLTNPTVLAPYAAQTIKVEGKVYGDKHAIDVKKLYVKDGENWKEITLKDEHHGSAEGEKAEHKEHHHD